MQIAVIGIGYVGLVTAACFAELGATVYCQDIDTEKIEGLKQGVIPIYEPGLDRLVLQGLERGRLVFTSSLEEAIRRAEVIFVAVGTPSRVDGSADLSYVFSVAREIGLYLDHYSLVVDKSTVPVGTAYKVKEIISSELAKRNSTIDFDVASNPEFLKEGKAIEDFMRPDRVVVGVENERSRELMTRLYKPILLNNFRVLFMDIPSAELSKYAANAMLALRISFINDIALLADKVGADIHQVRKAIGSDSRIGNKFLYAGCGYGGSCFPKDVKALVHTAEEFGLDYNLLKEVERINERQKGLLYSKLKEQLGSLKGRTIALWGLSFKPETDDLREAPSLTLIRQLLSAGCSIRVYDPIAMPEMQQVYPDEIYYASDLYDAALDADAIVHLTEWKEFRMPSWSILKKIVRNRLLMDGRNVFSSKELREYGFTYIGIGCR